MLQVKIKFRLKLFNLLIRMILHFLCLLALILRELGLGDKLNWESTYSVG